MFLLLTVSYLSATPLYVTAWHFMAGCILFFRMNMSGCACFTNCNGSSGGGEAVAAIHPDRALEACRPPYSYITHNY